MEGIAKALSAPTFTVSIFGLNIELGESMIVAWMAMGVIIVFGLLMKFVFVPRFKEVPGKFQLCIELAVDGVRNFTASRLSHGGEGLSPYFLTIALYMVTLGLLELLGFRPPTVDLSMTASLAILTFILINVYAIRYKGLKGRIKSYASPNIIMAPIHLMTDIAKPVSLACRMFGNLLGGLIVMDLIYGVLGSVLAGIPSIGIPAFLSIYFTLFHTLIQTYIFVTLSVSFIQEGME